MSAILSKSVKGFAKIWTTGCWASIKIMEKWPIPMSIETTVTRAWQRQAAWLWLLLPISWLYGLITMLRRQAYKFGLLASYRAPVPVMVIGNISVGGSGKTPIIIALVDYLQAQGIKVRVINPGYRGDYSQMPTLVDAAVHPVW